jgi:hypothetical protein
VCLMTMVWFELEVVHTSTIGQLGGDCRLEIVVEGADTNCGSTTNACFLAEYCVQSTSQPLSRPTTDGLDMGHGCHGPGETSLASLEDEAVDVNGEISSRATLSFLQSAQQ